MKVTKTDEFEWWNADDDSLDVPNEAYDYLEEAAETRMREMSAEGYSSGELVDEYEGVSYAGWWSVKTNQ